ncbi:MAG: VOC family protein [Pseudomonadota bacterium]
MNSELRYIFHLSIPVSSLKEAKKFYTGVLGARPGREEDEWVDMLLWGHQITLQLRPGEVLPLEEQGKRHFGVVLPWSEWEAFANNSSSFSDCVLKPPIVLMQGTQREQAKVYVSDPSNNIIEVKAYRNPKAVLGIE